MNEMIEDIIDNLERNLRSHIREAEEHRRLANNIEAKIILTKETIALLKGLK